MLVLEDAGFGGCWFWRMLVCERRKRVVRLLEHRDIREKSLADELQHTMAQTYRAKGQALCFNNDVIK
jgi:hypothetical protein